MSIREIEAIHKISEVLAEAFAKVKYISGEYLSSVRKEDSNGKSQKESKAENEKSEKLSKPKEHSKPKAENPKSETSNPKQQNSKESKTEQKKTKQNEKKEAHPDRPKKPISPFFRFNQQNLNKVKAQYPNLSHTEVVSIISKIWGQLQQTEKIPYEKTFKQDLKKYEQQMKKFYVLHPEQKSKKMLKQERSAK